MKLTTFRSGKGDCLLLTGSDNTNILVDGGVSNAYRDFVRPELAKLQENNEVIDLVYVSHIDADHIEGILALIEDHVKWRRRDYQHSTGNTAYKDPKVPRPPEIKTLWHNSFTALIDKNKGPIEDQLVKNSRVTSNHYLFSGETQESIFQLWDKTQNFATSIRQGIRLTLRAGGLLNIPHNPETKQKLITVEEISGPVIKGSMKLIIIGPFKKDLVKLRKEWNKWLTSNKEAVDQIEEEIKEDRRKNPGMNVMDEGQQLASTLRYLVTEIGDRTAVTPPNLASLMLLVEEGNKKIILTGDGHAKDIIKGLEHHNKLDNKGRLHIDILKVQHHGSFNNINKDFCERITSPNYIFCGNGDHHNPHWKAIKKLIDARAGLLNSHPQAGKPYKLWFNCNSTVASTDKRKEHMKEIEDLVKAAAENSELMTCEFVGDKFKIQL